MQRERIVLEVKAEVYSPLVIDKIELIGRMRTSLERMVEETARVASGGKTFYAIYVEGLYGSGKTLLMRKYCNEVLKAVENVIPIYVYLGEQDFRPFSTLKNYRNIVELFITKNIVRPSTIGSPGLWKNRFQVLDKAVKDVENLNISELEKFYKALEVIEREGYYPVVVFDEFERLLYTGEGLRTDEGKKCFAEFAKGYLEVVRGQRFPGVFALVTTFPLLDLLKRSINLRFPHITDISKHMGLDLGTHPEQFPMIAPHVVQSYDERVEVSWTASDLDLLARKYNLIVHTDLINIIARVLPTPRAIINIAREALRIGIKDVVSTRNFIEIIKPRYMKFKERLFSEKVNGKFIIQPRTTWHEKFEKLLREGVFEATREKYLEVAKVLNIEFIEEDKESVRKARQKASNTLRKLSNLGLYEAKGGGIYLLNPYLLAYLLGIERLPSGEFTSLDMIIEDIKMRIKEQRRRRK